jgi:hypothetical protein
MKIQTVILMALVLLLLLGSTASAQTGKPDPAPWYVVRAGTSSAEGYYLTALAWQVSGTASGGRYRLVGPASPAGGNQCCCTYLPCVVRNLH